MKFFGLPHEDAQGTDQVVIENFVGSILPQVGLHFPWHGFKKYCKYVKTANITTGISFNLLTVSVLKWWL